MQPQPPAKPYSPRRKALLQGMLFEALLLGSSLLPDCELGTHLRNFTLLTHIPLLMFLQMGESTGTPGIILMLLTGFLGMSWLWGMAMEIVKLSFRSVLQRLNPAQRKLFWTGLGLIGLVLAVRMGTALIPARPRPFTPSPETAAVVAANNAFALDLYAQLKDKPGNLFFSPFGVSASLAMTATGARGGTQTEMTNVLHLGLAREKTDAAFQSLMTRLGELPRWNRIALRCANSLWCQQGQPIEAGFSESLQKNYSALVRPVDFRRDAVAVADEINRWVDRQTAHKIPQGIKPGQLHPDTHMALCDAFYFKGKWLHQFKKSATKPDTFEVSTNQTVTVPMMSQKARFKYALIPDPQMELLELPYVGQDLSMVIILPWHSQFHGDSEPQMELPELERQLTTDALHGWLEKLDAQQPHDTNVRLPRFTTRKQYDFTGPLKALGMPAAFEDGADFSGIDGMRQLYLSEVLQQTFVEVNEAGTEAAALTYSLVRAASQNNRFYANHPFLYLIRDNASGSILFMGRVTDPSQ